MRLSSSNTIGASSATLARTSMKSQLRITATFSVSRNNTLRMFEVRILIKRLRTESLLIIISGKSLMINFIGLFKLMLY